MSRSSSLFLGYLIDRTKSHSSGSVKVRESDLFLTTSFVVFLTNIFARIAWMNHSLAPSLIHRIKVIDVVLHRSYI